MTHTKHNRKLIKRQMRMLAIILIPVVALILGVTAPGLWANDDDDDDDDELQFEETWFNIEFNSSDQDVGVRAFVDGEPWRSVEIESPDERTILEVEGQQSLRQQGLAELVFESGEPTLADLSLPDFLDRFPEGTYDFEGITIEGDEIEGEAEFTHVIPCGPEISVGVNKNGHIAISWEEVDKVVHPAKTPDADGEVVCRLPFRLGQVLNIVGYQVVVETEEEDGPPKIFSIDLPAKARGVNVPPRLLAQGTEFQYEVLAIEESGNQTITEDDFCLNDFGGIIDCD